MHSTSIATHPIPGSYLDYRLVAVASLLLSLWLITIDPLINRDAIIYLRSADAYLQHGFIASQELFGRPLISICFASIHQLTGIPLVVAGQLLNSLFYALLCVGFVLTVKTLGGDRRVQVIAAIVILSHPIINDHRSSIMRDPAYWAFSMLAFRELLLYLRDPGLKYQLRWFAYIVLASLFRFEGIFFAVLAPLSLLAMKDVEHRFRLCLRLWLPQAIVVGLALAAALAIKTTLDPGARLFPAIERYIRRLFSLPDAFAELSASVGEIMLQLSAREDATLAVFVGLMAILVINTLRAITWPWVFTLLWGRSRHISTRFRPQDSILLHSHLLIVLAYLTAFTLINRFMLERYACQLVIFFLLYIPFILNKLWHDNSRPWKRVLVVLLLLGMSLDSIVNTDYTKGFIRDARDWVLVNTPDQARVVSNDKFLAYFTRRDVDWNAATRSGFDMGKILAEEERWRDQDYMVMLVRRRDKAKWDVFLAQHQLLETITFEGGRHGRVSIVALEKTGSYSGPPPSEESGSFQADQ